MQNLHSNLLLLSCWKCSEYMSVSLVGFSKDLTGRDQFQQICLFAAVNSCADTLKFVCKLWDNLSPCSSGQLHLKNAEQTSNIYFIKRKDSYIYIYIYTYTYIYIYIIFIIFIIRKIFTILRFALMPYYRRYMENIVLAMPGSHLEQAA